MPAWLPLLKALPYVTQIVTVAIPAFTRRAANARAEELVPAQIAELQEAVTHNAEAIQGLATQLQATIVNLDAGAAALQQQLQLLQQLLVLSLVLGATGTGAALWLLWRHGVPG